MFRPAVEEAARTIEVQLKAKLGISDGTGNNLITEAFSPKEPVDGHPRLRFPGFEAGTSDWTRGSGNIGTGSSGIDESPGQGAASPPVYQS